MFRKPRSETLKAGFLTSRVSRCAVCSRRRYLRPGNQNPPPQLPPSEIIRPQSRSQYPPERVSPSETIRPQPHSQYPPIPSSGVNNRRPLYTSYPPRQYNNPNASGNNLQYRNLEERRRRMRQKLKYRRPYHIPNKTTT